MAVLLVLSTFLVFVVIDFFMSRNKQVAGAHSTSQPRTAVVPMLSSASIEGILVPDQLRFHPGHTWLLEEGEKTARVGVDALASRVIGAAEKIETPKVGRWIRQGQKAFTFYTGGEKVELVSPVEGEVAEINRAVIKDPSLAAKDPYGNGWLVKVSVPEHDTVERNLLPQSLVRTWMKEEIRRVRAAAPALAQVAVMGGAAGVPARGASWRGMTHDVFLN
ncbi:MAG: glycine cleavage system protein H [Acidobacteria bacterium]|nr:glycine cleavage system protein H [Acidobacteriota bacterium]